MGMVLFILTLLVSFNRTINRLTKPVSFLVILSLLSSALISSFFYFKKIEEIAQDELNHVEELTEALAMITQF